MENVHQILCRYSKGPEIYTLLASTAQQFKIPLNIPETLLFMSSFQHPVLLFSANGYVQTEISEFAIDKFFERAEAASSGNNKAFPKYIHVAMNDRVRICFEQAEARDFFINCPHYSHRLQRYIPPPTNFASKIRVH